MIEFTSLHMVKSTHGKDMHKAFSLLELSIVLVIIGLLVGGILTGKSLIRAAELRSVTAELQNYKIAINTFRDKYFALPGDLTNAMAFWPACGDFTDDFCNGDGNGTIAYDHLCIMVTQRNNETYRAWEHLSRAGLVHGSFASTGCVGTPVVGGNVPALRIASNAGVMLVAGCTHCTIGNQNLLHTGVANNEDLEGAYLKPEEAWNIDYEYSHRLKAVVSDYG